MLRNKLSREAFFFFFLTRPRFKSHHLYPLPPIPPFPPPRAPQPHSGFPLLHLHGSPPTALASITLLVQLVPHQIGLLQQISLSEGMSTYCWNSSFSTSRWIIVLECSKLVGVLGGQLSQPEMSSCLSFHVRTCSSPYSSCPMGSSVVGGTSKTEAIHFPRSLALAWGWGWKS